LLGGPGGEAGDVGVGAEGFERGVVAFEFGLVRVAWTVL